MRVRNAEALKACRVTLSCVVQTSDWSKAVSLKASPASAMKREERGVTIPARREGVVGKRPQSKEVIKGWGDKIDA